MIPKLKLKRNIIRKRKGKRGRKKKEQLEQQEEDDTHDLLAVRAFFILRRAMRIECRQYEAAKTQTKMTPVQQVTKHTG